MSLSPRAGIRCNACGTSLASLTAACRCRAVGAPRPVAAPSVEAPRRAARTRGAAGRAVEAAMRDALVTAGLVQDRDWIREYAWALDEGRGYRADFRFVGWPILLEVEGQVHAIKAQRLADCQRASLAAALGWRVLRVHRAMVESGEAVALVRRAIETARGERVA